MICPKCGAEQIRFGTYRCKSCRDKYHAEWRAKNREKWNAQSRRWTAKNKERRKEIVNKYYIENREKIIEYHRAYYAANKDKYLEWNRKADKELRRTIKNRYKARKNFVQSEKYDPKEIFAQSNGQCVYCDGKATCLDHVIPISRGGPDIAINLVAACTSCNASKGGKLLHEWMR